jgi:pimeloyl-ACP methyl ester carboxylesterase
MSVDVETLLQYGNLQMAAESLFGVLPSDPPGTVRGGAGSMTLDSLGLGNRRASLFPEPLAQDFLNTGWEVVEHKSNTTTGFSGTLFRNPQGEYVLSFRSTEFADDAARDNQATNTLEIKEKGWAFGQIADMQAWYQSLCAGPNPRIPAGAPLTVTGYSLGGHLATAFTLLYPSAITATYTFNGAGVGLLTDGYSLAQVMANFNSRNAAAGNADLFSNSIARDTYNQLRVLFSGHTAVNSGDVQMALELIANRIVDANDAGPAQLILLRGAVQRVGRIVSEAELARLRRAPHSRAPRPTLTREASGRSQGRPSAGPSCRTCR